MTGHHKGTDCQVTKNVQSVKIGTNQIKQKIFFRAIKIATKKKLSVSQLMLIMVREYALYLLLTHKLETHNNQKLWTKQE